MLPGEEVAFSHLGDTFIFRGTIPSGVKGLISPSTCPRGTGLDGLVLLPSLPPHPTPNICLGAMNSVTSG